MVANGRHASAAERHGQSLYPVHYRKAPHIEMYPEVHDLAPKIMLAGSACKQDVHRADGLKPVDLLNRFAEIYCATKDIKTVRKLCRYPPNIDVVYPVL